MNPETLQDFLHTHIPATALLDLSVLETTADQTVLFSPHAPNRNHKNTAFGGSIALAGQRSISIAPNRMAISSFKKVLPATCALHEAT